MHDDMLERRLRDALRHEADGLGFTITAAELERRLAQRGRLSAGRRTAWLLAAAVGVGLVGVGGALAGLFDRPTQSPFPTNPIAAATPAAPSQAPTHLGSIDELLTFATGGDVVIAQAHDHVEIGGNAPADAMPERASIDLGTIDGSTRYQLTFACLGDGNAALDIRLPFSRGPRSGPDLACDGTFYEQPIVADEPRAIALDAPRLASWRIVVRRLEGESSDLADSVELLPMPGEQELIRADKGEMGAGGPEWVDSGLLLEEVGAVPGRWDYTARVACAGGEEMRLIFGHAFEGGRLEATTETLVPCDDRGHAVSLGIVMPYGSDVYVATAPETQWSVLVAAEQPPIAIAEDRPGWQLQVGFGPHLEFDPVPQTFSAPGPDGGGPVLIVFACAGTAPIDVTVDAGRRQGGRTEQLVAACTAEGAETAQSFVFESSTVSLRYAAPIGTWAAITILVPNPLTVG